MDAPWDIEDWQPTVVISQHLKSPFYERPEPERLQELADALREHTLSIKASPYDPRPWLKRSSTLGMLGYPELSVGDAYKSLLLVEAAKKNDSKVGQTTRGFLDASVQARKAAKSAAKEDPASEIEKLAEIQLDPDQPSSSAAASTTAPDKTLAQNVEAEGPTDESQQHPLQQEPQIDTVEDALSYTEQQSWLCLIVALEEANAIVDARRLFEKGREQFASSRYMDWWWNDESRLQFFTSAVQARLEFYPSEWLPEERSDATRLGHIYARPYPWMTRAQFRRSRQLEETMASQIREASGSRTVLRPSAVKGDASDVLGVFASDNMKKGEIILEDRAHLVVSIDPSVCLVCANPPPPDAEKPFGCEEASCSEECTSAARGLFHDVGCGTDIDITELKSKFSPTPELRVRLFMRYIATAVQGSKDSGDPLLVPSIARLTPNYGGRETHRFALLDHVAAPITLLQGLGVDVFADERFDTWRLQTIYHRMDNNAHGWKVHGVYNLMTLINHSCEPNTTYEHEKGKAQLTLRLLRDVEKDEELTVTYIGEEDIPLMHRRYQLLHWIGEDCRCGRCLREDAEGEADLSTSSSSSVSSSEDVTAATDTLSSEVEQK